MNQQKLKVVTVVNSGASKTTSAAQMGGLACRCLRPARRESTASRSQTSLQTKPCLETFSTATTTTPRRARRGRSSRPPSGTHTLSVFSLVDGFWGFFPGYLFTLQESGENFGAVFHETALFYVVLRATRRGKAVN